MSEMHEDPTFIQNAGEWIVWVITCVVDWFTKGAP